MARQNFIKNFLKIMKIYSRKSIWRSAKTEDKPKNKLIKKAIKALAVLLELLAVSLIIYLIFAPVYPIVKYYFQNRLAPANGQVFASAAATIRLANEIIKQPPKNEYANRLVIAKIGVNAPIIKSLNADYALSRGIWLSAANSSPGENGNAVMSGHRFKYLPPNNLTLYLLDKLKKGDIISAYWNKKVFHYQVTESKIVEPTNLSILEQTKKPIITLYTCEPVFSQKNSLVVIAELMAN